MMRNLIDAAAAMILAGLAIALAGADTGGSPIAALLATMFALAASWAAARLMRLL